MLQKLTRRSRALQSAQLELERKQHADSLRKGLEKRPDKESLIERTRCHSLSSVAHACSP